MGTALESVDACLALPPSSSPCVLVEGAFSSESLFASIFEVVAEAAASWFDFAGSADLLLLPLLTAEGSIFLTVWSAADLLVLEASFSSWVRLLEDFDSDVRPV